MRLLPEGIGFGSCHHLQIRFLSLLVPLLPSCLPHRITCSCQWPMLQWCTVCGKASASLPGLQQCLLLDYTLWLLFSMKNPCLFCWWEVLMHYGCKNSVCPRNSNINYSSLVKWNQYFKKMLPDLEHFKSLKNLKYLKTIKIWIPHTIMISTSFLKVVLRVQIFLLVY